VKQIVHPLLGLGHGQDPKRADSMFPRVPALREPGPVAGEFLNEPLPGHCGAVGLQEEEGAVSAFGQIRELEAEEAVRVDRQDLPPPVRGDGHPIPKGQSFSMEEKEPDIRPCPGREGEGDPEVGDHRLMSDVALLEVLVLLAPVADVLQEPPLHQDLRSSRAQGIDHGRSGVAPQPVEVPMMEEKLKSSVDGVSALRKEEKVLRCGKEPVVGGCLKEDDVAVLKDKRRPPGVLGAGEFGEPTRRRRTAMQSGGRNRAEPLNLYGSTDRNGIGRCFGDHPLVSQGVAFRRHPRCTAVVPLLYQTSPDESKRRPTSPKRRSR